MEGASHRGDRLIKFFVLRVRAIYLLSSANFYLRGLVNVSSQVYVNMNTPAFRATHLVEM